MSSPVFTTSSWGELVAHHHREDCHLQMERQRAPQDHTGKTKYYMMLLIHFCTLGKLQRHCPMDSPMSICPTNMDQCMDNHTKIPDSLTAFT